MNPGMLTEVADLDMSNPSCYTYSNTVLDEYLFPCHPRRFCGRFDVISMFINRFQPYLFQHSHSALYYTDLYHHIYILFCLTDESPYQSVTGRIYD